MAEQTKIHRCLLKNSRFWSKITEMDQPISDQSEEQEKNRPGNIYDAFVKNIFGRLLVFADFLLNYADPKFVSNIELSKIYPAPTHHFGLEGDERIS
ncbi:MAG: hypothetical protein LBQ50_05865, partial [Planctomycetaceae bacterium]|nr:hypothetical protein [Planctomycetaceae bacterium]